MSLKQEIETWVTALEAYDSNEFDAALVRFEEIADTSKILFNMGVIHATLGEHEKAVEKYQRAIKLDQYLAVAYFQQGVSNFLIGDFEDALANFNDTLLYLRGNIMIDYAQLGLLFKLYSCEVLFNRGLCYTYLKQKEAGMQDLRYAQKEKVVEDHDVIDEAIREEAEGYTVFSIPVGVVYRPNEAKVRNLKQKDYLGKAKLVAATDRSNAFTGFAGVEKKVATGINTYAKDDRPEANISFAATNLVKPGLQSKRQQSEPPVNRDAYPPTPPPDDSKSPNMSRAASVRAGPRPTPAKLNIEHARSNSRYEKDDRRPVRSSSATPSQRTRDSHRDSRDRRPPRRKEEDDAYDIYDIYDDGGVRDSRSIRSHRSRAMSRYDDDEDGSEYDDDYNEGDFEMLSTNRISSRRESSRRESSRRDPRDNIRYLLHYDNESGYIKLGPAVDFRTMAERIEQKYNIHLGGRSGFKLEYREEGEARAMRDDDDLDVARDIAVEEAEVHRASAAKIQIWVVRA